VTSPLTTYARETQTAGQTGEVVAVARRDHLCAALEARLGLDDVCGRDALVSERRVTDAPKIAAGLPSDAYGRGAPVPILPNEPTLFFAAGVENICKEVAGLVVDAPDGTPGRWSSAKPDRAMDDFVAVVMALPLTDARALRARQLLGAHFATAMQEPGITATQALRSTFVVACLAPSATSIGL
jgi:hypothetical protein